VSSSTAPLEAEPTSLGFVRSPSRKVNPMKPPFDASGHAALSICESLLLCLTEMEVIDADEAKAVLTDAAGAHRNAMVGAADPGLHGAAADIIELIMRRGNSVHGV
jgi:hypothetical protein